MSLSEKLKKLIADPDVAIDLGTANTRLFAHGKGLVCDEPSAVSQHQKSWTAPGNDLPSGYGSRVSPLRGGVVTDVVAAASLLKPLLVRARKFGLRQPRVLACAPSDASPSEVRALVTGVNLAGAPNVRVVPEPLAAAVGSGLDISSPYAQMLVDIGDGVTDIAVIRSGSLIRTAATRNGCSDMHAAVRATVAKRYGVILYEKEAERLTREIGTARSVNDVESARALGIKQGQGCETDIEVSSRDAAEAIQPVIDVIRECVRVAFHSLASDVAVEVIESGIHLTGGGACLRGMKEIMAEATSVEVKLSPDPLHAVINGAGQMLAVGANTGLWHA